MAQRPRKQIENKPSSLLTREENQQIFRLIGTRCKTILTAVVQLYHTQAPNHLQWVKKDTGVLCFVRDSVRKTYFFRLFCLKRNCMVWEQETYTQMEYDCRCSFLHTFEGDKCVYAFNFASLLEAEEARQTITDKLARRLKADYKNVPRKSDTMVYSNDADPLQDSDQKSLSFEQAMKKKRRRNLTKADIGNPSEFRHICHIGWHRDKGLDVINTDSVYQEIFKKAGIDEQVLQNRKTREFILDFIQNYSDIESIKQEAKKNKPAAPLPAPGAGTAVPPVPPRTAPKPPHNRAAPPPPPSNNQPPPRPTQYRSGVPPPPPGNAPPPPPPPVTAITNGNSTGAGAPPPPPLPPVIQESSTSMINNQLPPMDNSQGDMRSALLQSIREGATLKPVDVVETKSNESERSDLLKKIREGVSLKSAAEREIRAPTTPVNEVPDIAMALRKALETRSNRIHSDTDTDSDISNDDEWDA